MTNKPERKRRKEENENLLDSLREQMTESEREKVSTIVEECGMDHNDPMFHVMWVMLSCRTIFAKFDETTKRSLGRVQSQITSLESTHNAIHDEFEGAKETLRSTVTRIEARNNDLEKKLDECIALQANALKAMGYKVVEDEAHGQIITKDFKAMGGLVKQVISLLVAFGLGIGLMVGCQQTNNNPTESTGQPVEHSN